MLNELFTFPIVMVDGDNEERKTKNKEILGTDEEEEYDMVFGEAEYPYWDFIGIEDRWLPSTESLEKAIEGKFEACTVRFLHVGQLLVPWSKKKFKAEITKFIEAYNIANPKGDKKQEVKIMAITAEQFKKQMDEEGKDE